MPLEKPSLENLIKSRNYLNRIDSQRPTLLPDIYRGGLIKGFEICFDLTWKTLHQIFIFQGSDVFAHPRDIFIMAEEQGLIKERKFWIKCIGIRSKSIHAYHENVANVVVEFIPEFLVNVDKVLEKLNAMDLGNK